MDYRTQITGWLPDDEGNIPYWVQPEPITKLPVEFEGHTIRKATGEEVMLMTAKEDFSRVDKELIDIAVRDFLAHTLWQIEALPEGAVLEIHCNNQLTQHYATEFLASIGVYDARVLFTPPLDRNH